MSVIFWSKHYHNNLYAYMPIAKCLNCLNNCISKENNGNDDDHMHMLTCGFVYIYNVGYEERPNT